MLLFKYNTYDRSTSWREKILNLKREIKSDPELAHLFHSFLHKKSLYVRIFTLSRKSFIRSFRERRNCSSWFCLLTERGSFRDREERERERESNATTITASDWLPAPSPSVDGERTFEHSKVMCLVNFHHELFFPQLSPFWEFKFKINIIPNALFFT